MTAPVAVDSAWSFPDLTHDAAYLSAFIGALPRDPDDIAAYFRDRNVRGVPGAGCDCPVSVYLNRDLYGSVSVGSDSIEVECATWAIKVTMPTWLHAFVCAFDAGLYPFLYVQGEVD